MSLTKIFIFQYKNAVALFLLLLAVALSFWPFVEVISGNRAKQDQVILNGTDSSSLLTATVQPDFYEEKMREGFYEETIPDVFGFRISGFFSTSGAHITVSELRLSQKHEIRKGESKTSGEIGRDVEFAKKYPDHAHEVITTYAFSYPLTGGAGDFGAWLYFDKDDNLIASRPIKGLGDEDQAGNDERYEKKWEGKELVDTKGAKIDNVCGTQGFHGKYKGQPVQNWQDVKWYCWTPKCLMVEEDQGSKNNGCWVYQLEDDSYRAYTPLHVAYGSWKSDDSDPQKSCSTQYLTCAPFLFFSLILSML